MTQAKEIVQKLGDLNPDEQWLQTEIACLSRQSIVSLEHIRDLHEWLDGKRKTRQSCRLVGE